MSLTAYCEFAEVRAALGVNSLELSDAVIALPVYEMGLVRELNRLSTSLDAAFSTISGKAEGARTPAEAELFSAVRLFSVYVVASQVGVSLPNFMPKAVADGKASITRFSGEPYKGVMDKILAQREAYRANLVEAYALVTTGAAAVTTPPTLFLASTRQYDPVTGS